MSEDEYDELMEGDDPFHVIQCLLATFFLILSLYVNTILLFFFFQIFFNLACFIFAFMLSGIVIIKFANEVSKHHQDDEIEKS